MITGKIKMPLLIFTAAALIAATGKSIIQKNYTKPGDIIGCGPDVSNAIYAGADGKFITVLPGWGDHTYPVSTNNDSAQIYFNQGLSMHYSYHQREALASFREAARFDSTAAMIYWGQALASGPTYNYGYAYKQLKTIPAIIENMNRYAVNASAKEKELIEAMNKRYDADDSADTKRNQLNEAYMAAMKPLVTQYPDDIDIKALYADAVMLIHAWDFWNNDGTAKPWTKELVQYCEDILQKDPHHPGALHYYIHVTEASRDPQVALFCADSLKKLFPGIAHMVHMSSHEYERTGKYALGVDANEKADASLVLYDSLAKGLFLSVHVPHYYAVEAYCAISGAMREAISKSLTCRKSVSPTHVDTYDQYLYMFPELTMVRMGKWNDLLKDTASLHADWTYAVILHHFATGMAYANTGNITEAQKRLSKLVSAMKDTVLQIKFSPVKSSPHECAIIAENILAATIHFEKKEYAAALSAMQKAIDAEDKLIYTEPKLWMIPARQYLGAYLLQLNKPEEAEAVYRQDLVWNPGNGWSLLGLSQSLIAQNKMSEAAKYKPQYMYSFSHAEVMPTVSAY
ncbi:MAG TPA: hypothetical protein VFW07_26735 [Parafilimonas sp.]|nr:hypothetical protein [Parafilimonas sp.]